MFCSLLILAHWRRVSLAKFAFTYSIWHSRCCFFSLIFLFTLLVCTQFATLNIRIKSSIQMIFTIFNSEQSIAQNSRDILSIYNDIYHIHNIVIQLINWTFRTNLNLNNNWTKLLTHHISMYVLSFLFLCVYLVPLYIFIHISLTKVWQISVHVFQPPDPYTN